MSKLSKIKFDIDFNKVRSLLNEFDPMRLIEGEAPIDEYDFLSKRIFSNLYNKRSIDEIRKTIMFELERHFCPVDLTELKEPDKTGLDNNFELLLKGLDKENRG
jgi:hypothetical protein